MKYHILVQEEQISKYSVAVNLLSSKTKLRCFSLQANYIDRATATCQQS
jgi:hypothetical protein